MHSSPCCAPHRVLTPPRPPPDRQASSGSAVFEKICSIKVKGRDSKVKVYRPVESERRITKKLAPVRDSSKILGRDMDINRSRQARAPAHLPAPLPMAPLSLYHTPAIPPSIQLSHLDRLLS
jgi:hypothetical protein